MRVHLQLVEDEDSVGPNEVINVKREAGDGPAEGGGGLDGKRHAIGKAKDEWAFAAACGAEDDFAAEEAIKIGS